MDRIIILFLNDIPKNQDIAAICKADILPRVDRMHYSTRKEIFDNAAQQIYRQFKNEGKERMIGR